MRRVCECVFCMLGVPHQSIAPRAHRVGDDGGERISFVCKHSVAVAAPQGGVIDLCPGVPVLVTCVFDVAYCGMVK